MDESNQVQCPTCKEFIEGSAYTFKGIIPDNHICCICLETTYNNFNKDLDEKELSFVTPVKCLCKLPTSHGICLRNFFKFKYNLLNPSDNNPSDDNPIDNFDFFDAFIDTNHSTSSSSSSSSYHSSNRKSDKLMLKFGRIDDRFDSNYDQYYRNKEYRYCLFGSRIYTRNYYAKKYSCDMLLNLLSIDSPKNSSKKKKNIKCEYCDNVSQFIVSFTEDLLEFVQKKNKILIFNNTKYICDYIDCRWKFLKSFPELVLFKNFKCIQHASYMT